MPDLNFTIEDAEAVKYAAAPTIQFRIFIENNNENERIQSIGLRCQVNIEPTKRRYSEEEQKRLYELFGEPKRWSQTLRPMLWTNAFVNVPSFSRDTETNLPISCTFDFNVGGTKYFAGLESGEIPLLFLFSGTIFYDAGRGLQIAQISWEKEAKYNLPVSVWQEMMDYYYSNSVWLSLRRDIFDRLYQFKIQNGQTSWEQALETLLENTGEEKEKAQKV